MLDSVASNEKHLRTLAKEQSRRESLKFLPNQSTQVLLKITE